MKKENSNSCSKKTSIGGQALMEGIMMRGPKTTAMAVRNTKGEIIVEKSPTTLAKRPAIAKLPIIRGVVAYIDSMVSGSKYMTRSAQLSGLEELEEELAKEKAEKKAKKAAEKKSAKNPEKANEVNVEQTTVEEETQKEETVENINIDNTATEETKPDENDIKSSKAKAGVIMTLTMIIGVVLGLALSVVLFIYLPTALYGWTLQKVVTENIDNTFARSIIKSLFEGILKILIVVGYMSAISLMKDIRRVFRYHGAEHKTIFCYEKGLDLTVENVRKQKRFHPRCGTSFLILMVLVSIFISFFIDPIFFQVTGIDPAASSSYVIYRTLIKLCLLPITVGIGYELIKLAGKHDNIFTRIISAPGVWLQHITVFEPDDDMIECAICAIKEVIPDDGSDNW